MLNTIEDTWKAICRLFRDNPDIEDEMMRRAEARVQLFNHALCCPSCLIKAKRYMASHERTEREAWRNDIRNCPRFYLAQLETA